MNGLFLLGGSEAFLFWMEEKKKKDVELEGIDPPAFRMQSGRSTI